MDATALPTAYASPLLAVSGAVDGEGADAGVAAHYGDPMGEQRALAGGAALVDLSHRGVVTVTGPDRLTWLHSLTSGHLSQSPPGQSAQSLVLSPKGHVEHDLHLVDDGETTWLTVEPGTAGALVAWLSSMRFLLRVEVADVTAAYAVVGCSCVGVPSRPGVIGVWQDPWPGVGLVAAPARGGEAHAAYGPIADHPGGQRPWQEWIVARDSLRGLVRGDGEVGDGPSRWAGTWASEALRVAAWQPRLGHETDHRTIAHEVDWLRTAVHLHKGCYRGQETIARVHNLGRPPRRLAFVHLDGSEHVLPVAGSPVLLAGREVGRLTSVARHFEDGPIGLVLLKRNTDETADLVVDGVTAAQTPIVRV